MAETAVYPPQDPHRAVRLWLYALAVLIAIMVLVGGATRLTDSGLSITEWAPISGFIPPLNEAHWLAEFDAYKTTDEWKTQNFSMTMDEFKFIYWWEWGHRFLGRLIGLFILIPMIAFWLSGRLTSYLKKASVGIFVLICFQGFLGWWMVKSGLVDRVDVSQIRLAVHLTAAFILLAIVVWVARSLASHTEAPAAQFTGQAAFLTGFVLLQIFIGGLVAGLDAGMAYNTWPSMNGEMIPAAIWAASPWWVNLTDNAVMVQFLHRTTAYLLWGAILWHAIAVHRALPGTTHMRRAWLLFALVSVQALMGIAVLIMQVPLKWALIHQFGGVVIMALAVAHWRALKPTTVNTASQIPSRPLHAAHAGAEATLS
ncbi:MAG: COX15/CtaA family protein [Pseudomonadota bacterium]